MQLYSSYTFNIINTHGFSVADRSCVFFSSFHGYLPFQCDLVMIMGDDIMLVNCGKDDLWILNDF